MSRRHKIHFLRLHKYGLRIYELSKLKCMELCSKTKQVFSQRKPTIFASQFTDSSLLKLKSIKVVSLPETGRIVNSHFKRNESQNKQYFKYMIKLISWARTSLWEVGGFSTRPQNKKSTVFSSAVTIFLWDMWRLKFSDSYNILLK